MSKRELNMFRGNMVFSSINQLQFMTTSRRDDLISLCYLLVFCINQGKLPNIEVYEAGEKNDDFKKIREAKLKHNLADLCNEKYGTLDLADFITECFSYRFKDKPNYAKLRAILEGLIEFEDFSDSNDEELKDAVEETKEAGAGQQQNKDSDEFKKPEPVNRIVKDIMKDLK